MTAQTPMFRTYFANTNEDILAAQKLRHDIFVKELGADQSGAQGRETDAFDTFATHLLLADERRPANDRIVGVYRLLTSDQANLAGGFSSESEYDLTALKQSGRRLLELGRSCVHADYRGGMAMFHLWRALAEFVESSATEILFGVASFHGTDAQAVSQALSLLHESHLAPKELRTVSRCSAPFEQLDANNLNRKLAMADMPALIKAYLRLGGVIGQGAYIDHAFNTTDVCMIVDVATLNANQKAIYGRDRR